MKIDELFPHTFKALARQIDSRPLWQQCQSSQSAFCQAVVSNGYLTEAQMQQAVVRYRLGATRDAGVIFWQIDEHDIPRDGKIMYYREDCHRDHDRHPTWTNSLLRQKGLIPEDWQSEHCLFGLHLLQRWKGTVAIVESEKTAIIMSALKPECLWLATGGKTELNVAKLKPLCQHKVILFPDTDENGQTYREWYDIAEAAGEVYEHPFTVSALLEQRATPAQKAAKIDLVDFLF